MKEDWFIAGKYKQFTAVDLKDRTWVNNRISKAPLWCAVDLRDGNQAIYNPMTKEKKRIFFNKLLEIGFKAIEVGFPSASQTEFDFARMLIDEKMIPDDVSIQVLVQARKHLVDRTFEALDGAKNVTIHLYNSTSPAQRRDVFMKEKPEIIDIATSGTQMIIDSMKNFSGNVQFEYSPESFSLTELDFSAQISNAVIDVWDPKVRGKMILNLPTTVECALPNVYADQIEWMCKNINQRENVLVSLHTHNDRGTGVASTELGLLAGADRVEGTLFGNGERTGNADILTIALNMFSQGVHPQLDFSDVDSIREIYEKCTEMKIYPRQPYAGDMVFTAFSGSHQDAIAKGMKLRKRENRLLWDVPYLPIDPKDVGRDYEAIVVINSQSGKGGASFILEHYGGFNVPKPMQVEVGRIVQREADELKRVLENDEIISLFKKEFVNREDKVSLLSMTPKRDKKDEDGKENISLEARLKIDEKEIIAHDKGDGVINALSKIFAKNGFTFHLGTYEEHAMSEGSAATAAAYISIETCDGKTYFGAGVDTDILWASANALCSAVNRAFQQDNS
ncbi:MAG: 2-isopropylmalate synthase [Chitinispirillales bacterium]|jgi:2-isopropylmalate synthase|nr:2-isopropylmalate synthase [Chitinispirillales bacterium]